ncbi:MAG: PAS domain S-box protein [Actinomycetota bacterium]
MTELVSVRRTTALSQLPSREADYEPENAALVELAQVLASAPEDILQALTEAALRLCQAHSAGVSLLEDDDERKRFHWRAIAGKWSEFIGGGTPRDFGPCGTVIDFDEPLLFSHPERDFPYIGEITPPVEDALLVPFHIRNQAAGTIWVVAHDGTKRFDAEDLRVMTNLAKFAAAAYQTLLASRAAAVTNEDLQHSATTAQRFAFIVESSDDAIVSKTLDGIITSWNKGAERIFGYTAEEAIGQHITFLMRPDRYEEEARIIESLRRGQRVEPFDTVRQRKDSELIDVSVTISPVKDIHGNIIGASKIARDITERKRAQEAQALLMREMRHRVNNLFLITNAIVSLSARSAKTPSDMARAVQGRLSALTRAHELTRPGLIEQSGKLRAETPLHALIKAIFEPYMDEHADVPARVAIEGCDFMISESAVTNVALVLHELATNAAKYGALSAEGGVVRVDCARDKEALRIVWKEEGGPDLPAPPSEEGFGSVLTRQVVVNQFRGKIERAWRNDGLVIEMEIPLAQVMPRSSRKRRLAGVRLMSGARGCTR